MTTALRPMNTGELLDRAFEMYRRRFLAFAGLSAIPSVAVMLVNIAGRFWWKLRPPELAHLFGTFNIGIPLYSLAFFHVNIIFQLLLYPSITRLCSTGLLGQPSSFSFSLREGFRNWRTNVGLALVQLAVGLILPEVVCVLLMAGVAALEAALKIDTSQWGSAFAPTFLFFFVAGIGGYFWMWSCVGLGWAAVDSEDMPLGKAVRRGFSLSSGRRRAMILSQLIPAAVWWTFIVALAIFARLLYLGLRAEKLTVMVASAAYLVFVLLGRWVTDTLVGPIVPIVFALFYYDQRVRKEGYDLERMMEAAGLGATVAAFAEAGEQGQGNMDPDVAAGERRLLDA
jgi:hypothetical protein